MSFRVETLSNAAGDEDSALPARCRHAEVVREADISSVQIPKAHTLFTAEEFDLALRKLPKGVFNLSTVRAMRARADQAALEGVPVLVGLGDSKFFAVRDSIKFGRTTIGEWAHVKYDKDGSKMFLCKVWKVEVRVAVAFRW